MTPRDRRHAPPRLRLRAGPRPRPRPRPRLRLRRIAASVLLLPALGLALGVCSRRIETPPRLADSASCPALDPAETFASLSDPRLDEISGVVASRQNPGILWVHNDSGAAPILYAIDPAGAVIAELTLSNAEAIDWEDIALGPGPEPGVDYLYVGDIGDNQRRRSSITLYRLREPAVPGSSGALSLPAEAIRLHYEHRPANAEALLVDPVDGGIFVITKEPGAAALYGADEGVLRRLAEVDVGAEAMVTAADISADGSAIAIRTYNNGYLFRRAPDRPMSDAFAQPPCPLSVAKEPQGEALGFDPAGAHLFSLSESRAGGGGTVPIYRIPLAPPPRGE